MKTIWLPLLLALLLLALLPLAARAQAPAAAFPTELALPRDSLRRFFGTYEFRPNFQLRVFSENNKVFGQRIGDQDKFQLFPRQSNVFFMKTMPAELEFRRTAGGGYETLLLRQDGQTLQARRVRAQPIELYDTIGQLDSLLYAAYNRRDLPAFLAYFAPTLEFYHDQTGYTTYAENCRRFRENLTRPTRMRRELVPGSLEVYPIAGFGAVELGTHRFYQTDPGQPERLVATPRFVSVWQQTGTRWQLVRVISYDH